MSRIQTLKAYAVKNVVLAATPEQIFVTSKYVKALSISALETNTDFIYVGDSINQNTPIAPGKSLEISGDALDYGGAGIFDISLIYIRVLVNNEGCSFLTTDGN